MRALVFALFIFSPLAALRADKPEDYPEVRAVSVGRVFARVAPAISMPVESPVLAPAKLKLTTRSGFFKKGEVWGVIDEERVTLEKRRLDLAGAQLARKQSNDADSGLARAELERRIQEIDTNLAAIETRDDSALEDIEGGEKFLEQLRKRSAEAKISLIKQRRLLGEKLTGLDGAREEELETLRLTLRAKESEIARLDEAAHLTMPCDGIITLFIEPKESGDYRLMAGKPFAVIEDRSRYFVQIPVGAQPWRTLPPASLTVRIQDGSRALSAHWYGSETTKNYGREEFAYMFEADRESLPSAAALSGGAVLAEIIHAPEKPVRLVPKLVFVAAHPEVFKGGVEWASAVRKVWPHAHLVVEGAAEIGVAEDDAPDAAAGKTGRPPAGAPFR